MKTIFVEQYAYAFAHHLPDLPVEHECHGLHGHTSTITLTMEVTHEGRIAFDRAALDEVQRLKPSSAKGRYIQKAVVSTSMGPGIQVDPNLVREPSAN